MISYFKNISFDKFINYLIIGYAFSLPTTIVGIVFFQHMLILAFLFRGDFSSAYQELKKSKVMVVLFLFIFFSLLSVLWSEDKTFALLYVKKYYHFLSIPIMYLYFNPKYIKHVFYSFLLAMLLSQVFSYGIFFEIMQYNNVLPSDPSPFMNHSDYSMFLAFTAVYLLNKIFFTHHKWHRVFYILFFITTTSNLFLNSGRTGQFIFVAALFVILFLNIKHKLKAGVIAIILAVGITTIAYNTSPVFQSRGTQAYNDITQTFVDNNYTDSFGIRVSLWIIGANVFSDNLLLGTGINKDASYIKHYAEKYNIERYKNHSGFMDYHSMYVQHAAQLGIVGLTLVIFLMYSIFTIKFKYPLFRNICLAFATTIFIYSIVGNVLHTIMPMTFFAFFVGLLTTISKHEYKD